MMMSIYVSYNVETGQIETIWSGPWKFPPNVVCIDREETDLTGYDPEATYIVDEILTPRPVQLTEVNKIDVLANDIDEVVFTNLPIPCQMQVFGGSSQNVFDLNVATESMTFDLVSEYRITIDAFPYQTYTVTINAT
jgi:hypothetical protein